MLFKIIKKINKITAIYKYNKNLRKMLKVHFPDREDIEILLTRIRMKNFDII